MRETLLLIAEHTDTHETESGKDICTYHDGWDDTRVARQLGHNNVGKVRTTRGRYFGNLPQNENQTQVLAERVDQLARQVAALEEMLEKLRPLIDDPEPTPTIQTNGHAKELN